MVLYPRRDQVELPISQDQLCVYICRAKIVKDLGNYLEGKRVDLSYLKQKNKWSEKNIADGIDMVIYMI